MESKINLARKRSVEKNARSCMCLIASYIHLEHRVLESSTGHTMKNIKRTNKSHVFMIEGKARTLRQIAEFLGLQVGTLYQRVAKYGYPVSTGQAFRPKGKLHQNITNCFTAR